MTSNSNIQINHNPSNFTANPDKVYYCLLSKSNHLINVNEITDNQTISDEIFESIIRDQLREIDSNYLHYIISYNRFEDDIKKSSFTAIRVPNSIIEKIVTLGISRSKFGINADEDVIDIKILNTSPSSPYIYQIYINNSSEPILAETPIMRFTVNSTKNTSDQNEKTSQDSKTKSTSPPPPPPSPS